MGLRISNKTCWKKFESCIASNTGYELQEIKIHLTKCCNSHCIMCAGREPRSGLELKRDEIKKIALDAKTIGLRKIKLFGGEPTLRTDLVGIISDCNEQKIAASLTTNGFLIDKKMADEIVSAGITEIVISLDSSYEQTHNYIRGVKDAYQKVVSAIKYINEARKTYNSKMELHINSVMMNINYTHLPEIVNFCIANGIDSLSLNPVTPDPPHPTMTTKNISGLFLTVNEIRKYNAEIVPQAITNGALKKLKLSQGKIMLFGNTENQIRMASKGYVVDYLIKGKICFKPWYYANINERGELVACNHVKNMNEYPVGDLRKNSICELWNSDRYRNFRAKCKPIDFESCRLCCFPYAVNNMKQNEKLVQNVACPRFS